MANDDPLGIFGGAGGLASLGGGLAAALPTMGLSMIPAILGMFGGDGVGSFAGLKAGDPMKRFVDPLESLFTANRGAAELGAGLARRGEAPMSLQTPMPGKMSSTGFGMDASNPTIPGLNMDLSGFLQSLLTPNQVQVPASSKKGFGGKIENFKAMRDAGGTDFNTGQRQVGVMAPATSPPPAGGQSFLKRKTRNGY